MRLSRNLRRAALLACCVGLAACGAGGAAPGGAGPTVTAAAFAAGERTLLRQGRLRTDRAAADAPVTAAVLAANFHRVAFGLEGHANRGRTARALHRREGPVRWHVSASGPDAGAAAADVARTFARLSGPTALPIAQARSAGEANFHVLFLGPSDYPDAMRWARRALGAPEARLIERFRTGRTPCTGSVQVGRSGKHGAAIVLIRAGHGDVMRLGCVEEEIAQALGLPNDDPSVRPSTFNDDEEFALLTLHDEMLLRILYDRRLRPGMSAAQAMPVVARIAAELRPGR